MKRVKYDVMLVRIYERRFIIDE